MSRILAFSSEQFDAIVCSGEREGYMSELLKELPIDALARSESSVTRCEIGYFQVKGVVGGLNSIYYYKNVPVNMVNGAVLVDFPSASRIKVWVDDVYWRLWIKKDPVVKSPLGNGAAAPGGFRFPGLPQFGIVLFQDGQTPFSVSGTTEASGQVFQVSNGVPIILGVNDGSVVTAGYDDNSGAFDCYVQLLQR
jgi:hypothetical protein